MLGKNVPCGFANNMMWFNANSTICALFTCHMWTTFIIIDSMVPLSVQEFKSSNNKSTRSLFELN